LILRDTDDKLTAKDTLTVPLHNYIKEGMTMKNPILLRIALTTVLCLALPGVSRADSSAPTLQVLEQRLGQLEAQVAEYRAMVDEYKKSQGIEPGKTGREIPGKFRIHQELDQKAHKGSSRKGKTVFTLPAMPGKFTIGGNMTGIAQGSPDTKLRGEDGTAQKIGGSYQANITLTNELESVNGTALANIRVSQGQGLEEYLTLYSNVDNNVYRPLELFSLSEIYYEQRLFDDKLTINVGKLDPTVFVDKSRYANSDPAQFLARIFNNSPVIEFPANTGGIRVGFNPFDWLYTDYLAMCGQSDWSNIQSNQFHLGRIGFKTNFFGQEGNYRFLTWINTNYHTKWMDTTSVKEKSYGFSLSFDQDVTRDIGLFSKFGWQDPRVFNPSNEATTFSFSNVSPNAGNFSLEYMWSGGMQVKGGLWGREHDFCGLAVGQVVPSSYMKDALEGTDDARKAGNETHLEAYYNFFTNEYLAISPMFQLINNPYGGDAGGDENIYIFTVRTHIDF